jgi:hypothetical protein
MNRYPHQQTANELASYGRYGDSVMVHMSPDEVSGIAALAPGGQLTINPVTGQPEAFSLGSILKVGLPIAASIAMPALIPAMPAALAGGLGSGLATAALTGDIKRGLVSGVMGAGMGAAAGAAGKTAAEAATKAAAPSMTNMANALGTAGSPLPSSGIGSVLSDLPTAAIPGSSTAGMTNIASSLGTTPATSLTDRVMAPFQSGSGFMGEIMKPRSILPLTLGAAQLGEMSAQDKREGYAEEAEAEREAKRRAAYDDLQGAYRSAQPGAGIGVNPYRNPNLPPPMYSGGYAGGGIIKTFANPVALRKNIYRGLFKGDRSGAMPEEDGAVYGGIDPVTIQRGIRGVHSVAPPPFFMPGFNPEFDYFQNDPENVASPPITGPVDWSQMYAGMPGSQLDIPAGPYFENVLDREKPEGMAAGGIADLNQPQQPSPEDVQMLAQALMGGGEQADQIVEAFVAKYGPDMFQAVRQMILQSATPNAQTEGMVKGPGGGMDDQVQGMIGDQQPVAVSPGEYIVPADVVSGLGDGSSDAGAAQLDGMNDKVRMARQGGRMEQPGPIDPRSVMPV